MCGCVCERYAVTTIETHVLHISRFHRTWGRCFISAQGRHNKSQYSTKIEGFLRASAPEKVGIQLDSVVLETLEYCKSRTKFPSAIFSLHLNVIQCVGDCQAIPFGIGRALASNSQRAKNSDIALEPVPEACLPHSRLPPFPSLKCV